MSILSICYHQLIKRPSLYTVVALIATVLLFSGCTSTSTTTSPVPDGHYRVQPGDNLYRIGLRFGQSMATLSAWNRLSNPNQIEVGQILQIRPIGSNTTTAIRPSQTSNTTATPNNTTTRLSLQWPVTGPILAQYNGTTQKGIDIGGKRGTSIKAAADGQVLYAGNEVRGYGNLILIRHNSNTLTAYAHNDRLHVRKDQFVKANDTIASMGDSGSNQVKLHFEVRINGKAVNPLPYLPKP